MKKNSIAILLMTDGREEYLKQAVSSALSMLDGPITEKWMHDDTGDENYRNKLRIQYPTFRHIGNGPRRGFGGAYRYAWETLAVGSKASFILSLEDDFIFNREIPLEDMAKVLEENPHVYQMALRRQAWSSEEIRAGGIIEKNPHEYYQQNGWISHRMFMTTNPSLYRKSLIETRTYPDVKDAEGHFTVSILNSDPNALFGYWGKKTDTPWVEHIGVKRAGGSY